MGSEVRLFDKKCFATIGQVGNVEFNGVRLGKAGRKRWLGRRPSVRGIAKNPIDHAHGGGEGRSPIGRVAPVTPWGKLALGPKTRILYIENVAFSKKRSCCTVPVASSC